MKEVGTMVKAGDVFGRRRGFKRPEPGSHAYEIGLDVWWLTSVGDTATAPAQGWQMLQVDEIVATATCGDLAIYREWLVDPDGKMMPPKLGLVRISDANETQFRPVIGLLRSIKQRRLELVTPPGVVH
jgi:hypothetical protein